MIAYLPGSEAEGPGFGRSSLELRATLPTVPTGPATGVIVRILDSPLPLAPRWTSRGAGADLEIERIAFPVEGALYGSVAGRFTPRLCRAAAETARPDPAACAPLAGRFETRLRFD